MLLKSFGLAASLAMIQMGRRTLCKKHLKVTTMPANGADPYPALFNGGQLAV